MNDFYSTGRAFLAERNAMWSEDEVRITNLQTDVDEESTTELDAEFAPNRIHRGTKE